MDKHGVVGEDELSNDVNRGLEVEKNAQNGELSRKFGTFEPPRAGLRQSQAESRILL